ncbi:MAG: DUF2125 domain-containing protein [Xanthobacteraceae bacterium]
MPGQSPFSMMQPPEQRAQRQVRAPAPRRRRRWPIWAPVTAVILLAVLWSGLWYVSASIADRTLAGWVEREAAAGRVYSCGSETIGGFPFSIRADCIDATAEIKNSQPPYGLGAKALRFVAEVYHPTGLVGDVTGPLNFAAISQPPSLTADWTHARIVVSGVPPDPESVSVTLDAPHLDRVGGGGETVFNAKRADLRGHIAEGAPHDHPVVELTLQLAGASAPTLHPLLAQPTEGALDAVIRGLTDLSPKPWAARFREMQAAGGGIEIKSLRLAQADAIAVGAGTLSVSPNGKLNGVLRVAIVGVERIVPLLGIDRLIGQGLDQLSGGNGTLDRLVPGLSETIRETANASVIENLKKMGEPTSIDNRPAIVLPLRFVDGAIYLGMLRVGEAPALF